MQTVDLTLEVPDHQGELGTAAVTAAKQLVTGLAGVLAPQTLTTRSENQDYPGQPGEKIDQEAFNRKCRQAVTRLRAVVTTEGRGPMFSGEEILAILNGDAADHETMSQAEVDRRGMYGPPYDTIESRHVFPTMSSGATCTRCGRIRSDVYTMTAGRICPGQRTGRQVMDRPQA